MGLPRRCARLVSAGEHAAEVLAPREEDELVRVDGAPLDEEGDVAELLVVDHRLEVSREGEHRVRGGLGLEAVLEAVVEVAPPVVPAQA